MLAIDYDYINAPPKDKVLVVGKYPWAEKAKDRQEWAGMPDANGELQPGVRLPMTPEYYERDERGYQFLAKVSSAKGWAGAGENDAFWTVCHAVPSRNHRIRGRGLAVRYQSEQLSIFSFIEMDGHQ